MKNQNIFKRYEIKYMLTSDQYKSLLEASKNHLIPDKFGESTICNIYYDTASMEIIRHSIDKPVYKEKLRLRCYNTAKADSKVFIELKKKFDGIVYKRRITSTLKDAENYLNFNIPLASPTQISNEIDYFKEFYKSLKPTAFISYERAAYFGIDDDSFRVTFDKNIIARDYDLSLKKGVYGAPLLPPGKILMEVKTSLAIPRWLLDFLSENHIYKTSFSKYGKAYEDILLPKTLLNSKSNIFAA